MNIKFISTLTTEDENAIAPIALRAIASILDLLPIAYSIQIDTSDSRIYEHSRAQPAQQTAGSDSRMLKAKVAAPSPSPQAYND